MAFPHRGVIESEYGHDTKRLKRQNLGEVSEMKFYKCLALTFRSVFYTNTRRCGAAETHVQDDLSIRAQSTAEGGSSSWVFLPVSNKAGTCRVECIRGESYPL